MMKRPGRTFILQEDQHLENLRKIIKRDFFSMTASNKKSDTIELSLNEYIQRFKSNQNNLFSELVESDKQKWKREHWWLQNQDRLMMIEQEKIKALKNESHQYQNMILKINPKDTKNNQVAVIGQQARNSIFFNRNKNFGSYLVEQSEKAKKVNYQNCKLVNKEPGQRNNQKQEQQQDENPITWGELQATPLRISGDQSEYRIPDRPSKDILLESLNKKINKAKINSQNSARKSEMMIKILGSQTPKNKNSSYIKSSSIKRAGIPSTPHYGKEQSNNIEMKGLLKFGK